jgi:lysophospholipase L1-like esterase
VSARCFVAIGDSFTARGPAGQPCWADELARAMPDWRYENLARRGATVAEVAREQLLPALELEPDLVSLICGANDVLLTTRPDVPAFAARFGSLLAVLREQLPGATLVTATYPDVSSHFPLRPRSRARVAAGMAGVNAAVRRLARRHGAVCLELAEHPERGERENFAADGFHPSAAGHRKAARAFALGLRRHAGIELEEAST